MTRFLPLVFCAALGGCVSVQDDGPESPSYRYPGGTAFVLHQPLEIPPDAATVRLQFGRMVPRNGVQEAEPHCIIEVNTVRETAQRVEPDHFEVVSVRRGIRTSALPAMTLRASFEGGSGPTLIYYETEFRLHSARQPGVRAMTCLSNQNAPGIAPFMRHLTVAEIRQALGALFTLEFHPRRL